MKTNGLAIAGMVVSIVGLFISFYGVIPLVGVILSAVALKQIPTTGDKGKGMAIAGLVCGIVGLAWAVLSLLLCGACSLIF
ncbi:MAG: DUF4190 domain-containing protein [Lachnospiraceae bacterium]|nr:DUF4190 domain-containing protein [Lachnospiraceae bacterium]